MTPAPGIDKYLLAEDDDTVMIGIIIGIAGTIVMFIAQVILLKESPGKMPGRSRPRRLKPQGGQDAGGEAGAEAHGRGIIPDTIAGRKRRRQLLKPLLQAVPGPARRPVLESAPDIAPEN